MRTSRPPRERIIILGLTPLAVELIGELQRSQLHQYALAGVVDDEPESKAPVSCPTLGPLNRLRVIVAATEPHRIVVALTERRGRTPIPELLESCFLRGVIVEDAVEFYERLTGKLALEALTPASIVFSKRFRPSRPQIAMNRVLSVLVAVAGLVFLSPLMALIALAIKLDSPGPVLFVQERVGAFGRSFRLMKFRTMAMTSAPRSEWAGDNGDRVTAVGKWLRALRLDELPQFFNILRGNMSLVGPRPHPVSNLQLFTLVVRNLNEITGTAIGYYELRSIVRPGLTGWAQVRYRYANNLEEEIEKLRFDLFYVKYASVWLDLRILFETARLLVLRRLADGVRNDAGQARLQPHGASAGQARLRPAGASAGQALGPAEPSRVQP